MTPNQKAFLDMIAESEIGSKLLAVSDNGYNVLVGSTPENPLIFDSYDKHPNILNAAMNSTAAGRYQFIHKTWINLQIQLDLSDFSPASQDAGCIELIRQCGALDNIETGFVGIAIAKCSHIWASLPGANYGQHENTVQYLTSIYKNAGGSVAI